MVLETARRPSPVGTRGGVVIGLGLAGAWAFWYLDLRLGELIPGTGGLRIAADFFGRALTPAMTSEAASVPPGTPPLIVNALEAAWTTTVFAAAAISLSVVVGLVLGFLASTAWWADDPAAGRSPLARRLRRGVGATIYGGTRVVIGLMRSVHEIFWAVLFLTAFGLSNVSAVVAIAIPYGGTLAKIFSEMVDEAPRQAGGALRAAGGTGSQVFCLGLLPRALPDMTSYAFYRFECALRSAAILGFFGYPTLGLFIRQSFNSTNYGEVWTYLYTLIALVVVFDLWSGALRKRLVG